MTFRDLTAFFSFLTGVLTGVLKLICVQILLIFDSVEVSERRPEEVISFF